MTKGNQGWLEYLDESMREMVEQSFYLLDREELAGAGLEDYSFVVFPMAKAYEGFVKKYLFEIGLLNEKDYKSQIFRIGRSMNPDLPVKYRNSHWLYGRMEERCQERLGHKINLPREIWNAWKQGRNKVFHYFPGRENTITLEEAREKIERFKKVMEEAFECRADLS